MPKWHVPAGALLVLVATAPGGYTAAQGQVASARECRTSQSRGGPAAHFLVPTAEPDCLRWRSPLRIDLEPNVLKRRHAPPTLADDDAEHEIAVALKLVAAAVAAQPFHAVDPQIG